MKTHSEDIEIDGRLVMVTRPVDPGPWPGVVMLHEVFGLDDIMRRQAERLASAGFVVYAPDLLGDGLRIRCVMAAFRSLSAQSGKPFEIIEACRQRVLADPDNNGKAGVLGFCMGGGFALVLADHGYDAASVNYGTVPKNLDQILTGACPIVASYPGQDKMLMKQLPQLEAGLAAHGVVNDVKVYPDAGHAFMNDAMAGPKLLHPLMRINHMTPHPESAADAWTRIEGFFGTHLR